MGRARGGGGGGGVGGLVSFTVVVLGGGGRGREPQGQGPLANRTKGRRGAREEHHGQNSKKIPSVWFE